jgi:LmbE family N-acetylglucosaminyl deacetylase
MLEKWRIGLSRNLAQKFHGWALRLDQERKHGAQADRDLQSLRGRTAAAWQSLLLTFADQRLARELLSAGIIGNTMPRMVAAAAGKRILVLAAHQDDETIGAGGTLLMSARAGAEFCVVYYTDGATGFGRFSADDVRAIRKDEARRVWQRIGNTEPIFWDYPNRANALAPDAGARLSALIESFRPDTIFLPSFLEQPIEHRRLNDVLLAANRIRPLDGAIQIWGYQITTRAPGSVVVDITDVSRAKRKINGLWTSQNAQMDYGHLAMGRDIAASYYLKSARYRSPQACAESFVAFPAGDYLAMAARFCEAPEESGRRRWPEPNFFIIGMQKSGTYWLTALLDAHPSIRCFPSRPGGADGTGEAHLFDIIAKLDTNEKQFRKSLRAKQGGFFADIVPPEAPKTADARRELVAALSERFDEFCHLQRIQHGKPLVGEKTTESVHHLDILQELYPRALKICILRDPRDRCVSFFFHQRRKRRLSAEMPLDDEFVAQYIERVKTDYRGLLQMTGRGLVVVYEDLASPASARDTVGNILRAIGASSDAAVVEEIMSAASFARLSGRPAGQADDGSHFRKGITGDWRNHLSPDQARRMVSELEDLTREVERKFALDLSRYRSEGAGQ